MFHYYLKFAKDVLPLPDSGRRNKSGRKPPKKVPSFHLTGEQSIRFIKGADTREKDREDKEKEEIEKGSTTK